MFNYSNNNEKEINEKENNIPTIASSISTVLSVESISILSEKNSVIDLIENFETNPVDRKNNTNNKVINNRGEKNYRTSTFNKKSSIKNASSKKKKYSLRDQRDDLERLELLLISLEAPSDYKKVYTKIYIDNNSFNNSSNNSPSSNDSNNNIEINNNSYNNSSNDFINNAFNDSSNDFISDNFSPRLDLINSSIDNNINSSIDASFNLSNHQKEEEQANYYYDIDKGNLIWLNRNLSLLNKRNIKLIETLKLIQRILKKI